MFGLDELELRSCFRQGGVSVIQDDSSFQIVLLHGLVVRAGMVEDRAASTESVNLDVGKISTEVIVQSIFEADLSSPLSSHTADGMGGLFDAANIVPSKVVAYFVGSSVGGSFTHAMGDPDECRVEAKVAGGDLNLGVDSGGPPVREETGIRNRLGHLFFGLLLFALVVFKEDRIPFRKGGLDIGGDGGITGLGALLLFGSETEGGLPINIDNTEVVQAKFRHAARAKAEGSLPEEGFTEILVFVAGEFLVSKNLIDLNATNGSADFGVSSRIQVGDTSSNTFAEHGWAVSSETVRKEVDGGIHAGGKIVGELTSTGKLHG